MDATDKFAFMNYMGNSGSANKFLQDSGEDYNAFTGSDMVAYIGATKIGKLQGITCSITREMMPLYVAGDPNPKTFNKGKRGIAGNLVFTQFDRHAILRDLVDARTKQLQNIWGLINNNTSPGNLASAYNSVVTNVFNPLVNSNVAKAQQQDLLATYEMVSKRALNFSDQIPPFNITITLLNESGKGAFVNIYGVQLVNEGWSYTIDDMNSEAAFTYVARSIDPLTPLVNGQVFGANI